MPVAAVCDLGAAAADAGFDAVFTRSSFGPNRGTAVWWLADAFDDTGV